MPFNNPIVAGENLIISGIRSEDFVEAEKGWRIAKNGSAQFSNLQSLGDFGATGDISADSFHLGPGGLYLPNDENVVDIINSQRWAGENAASGSIYEAGGPQFPKGCVAEYHDNNVPGTFSTEAGVIATRFPEEGERIYRIRGSVRIRQSLDTDSFALRFRYTRNNTVPTTASSTLRDIVFSRPNGGAKDAWVDANILHITGARDPNLPPTYMWVGMFILRYSGTGTCTVIADASNYAFITVEDLGPSHGSAVALARGGYQPSYNYGSSYSAPIAPAPTTQNYTKTYQPTWSRTYDGDNSTTHDDSASCYQGYNSYRGNTKSLVGYNYTQIQSDLAGATNIVVKLTFKVKHAYWNAGMHVQIGKHDYTGKGSTWVAAQVDERQYTRNNCVAGSTYTVTLPSSFGTEFKSGATRGIGFGPGSSNSYDYYGYLYGATESGKPYLTISYTK